MSQESSLEKYREYLRMLGRANLDADLAAKVDISGVIQTTMLEAYRDSKVWQELDDERQAAWLRRVFSNNLTDEVRKFRAKSRDVSREVPLQQSIENSAVRLDQWLAAAQSSPSRNAMRNEHAIALGNALASLPDEQRRAIELHHLKGLSAAEVASMMGKSEGAVAALVFRGTRSLRNLLQ